MKKLLIVVDMQNDFIDGSLGTKEAQAIVPKAADKIRSYREMKGGVVVYTQDTHFDNYLETLEGKNLPVVHCLRGTIGWEIREELAPQGERCFEKSGFGSPECADYVAGGEFETIELVGLCTDICVISNALLLKSRFPGTPILVDSSCCAGVTPKSHETALEAMKMCQIQVR